MSVPEGDRAKTQPFFIIRAEDLLMYTLKVTKNKKIFTDEYFDTVTAPIIDTAQQIYYNAFEANNIYVKSAEAWKLRKEKQKQAIGKCSRLLAQIKIAQRVYHFKTKRLRYWGSLIIEVRKLLKGWNENDNKRYNKLQ